MANIKKSFNFRNGVQVDDDNFIVNANGLVGIGTSIPREFLDVYGTAKITGLVTATNLTITGVSTFYSNVKVGSAITFNASTGIVSATRFDGDARGLTNIYAIAVDGWYINAGNISTSFNVGIGSDIPSSKLDVIGNAKISGIVTASSFEGYQILVGSESSATKNLIVKVAPKTSNHRYPETGSTNAYFIDGVESPFLTLLPGKTYYFDQSDASNTGNRLRFYLEADRTTLYTGANITISPEVPGTFGSYTQITVTDTTPVVLHYQSSSNAYMGNAVQFNSNIVNTPYQITTLAGISATTGVVSAYSFSGFGTNIQGINATNITNGTLSNSRLAQNVSISGIISAPSGIITSLTNTYLYNTGIATIFNLSVVNVNASVTGVITSPTFVGNLVGIASTARDLTSNARVNITDIQSQTSSIGISTVFTRLYAERIGVGTNSPLSDIHIRKNGQSRLQVTSNTAEAIVAVGRTTYGALIFGNTFGIYPYSDSKTLDIVNYDTGNLNYYLNYIGSVGSNGNFNWIYGSSASNPLMSLTYQGNLGIGITNPSVKLQVSGIASVSSLVTQNITATGNIAATGFGNSTSVYSLYVYGGKTQILNSDGTEIFPISPEDNNLYINSGISTFFNIIVQGNITAGTGIFGSNAVSGGNVFEERTVIDEFGSIGIGVNSIPAYNEFASRNRRITCLGIDNDSFGAAFGHVSIGTPNITSTVKLNVIGGDISVGTNNSHGLILTSPNGTRYRLVVSDAGIVSTVAV